MAQQEWSDADVVQEWTDADVQPTSKTRRFLTGLADPFVGGAQLVTRGLDAVGIPSPAGGKWTDVQDAYVKEREANYQAPEGFDWMRTAGNVVNPVTAIGPGKATILKNAVVGAGQSMLGPTADTENFWAEKANQGTLGAVLPTAITGTGKAVNKLTKVGQNVKAGAPGRAVSEVQAIFNPKDGVDRSQAAIAALRGVRGNVPGEQFTAGMAASPSLPEFKALEEGARQRPLAHKFVERDAANQQARRDVVATIADPGKGTINPETGRLDLSPAEQFRADVTRPLFDLANPNMVEIDPGLRAVLEGAEALPAVRQGNMSFSQAQANALGAGRQVPPGSTPGFSGALDQPGFVAEHGMVSPDAIYATEPFVPRNPATSIDQLQRAKDKLGMAIDTAFKQGDMLKYKQLVDARSQLDAAMKEQSGTYALGNEMFRNLSEPVNRADVAGTLENVMQTGGKKERAEAFLNALRDAPGTFKKSDLSPRFQTLEEVFLGAPEDLASLRNVGKSMSQEAQYANLEAHQGIVPEYLSEFEKAERKLPNVLMKGVTIARSILKNLGRGSDEEIAAIIDDAMLDPNKMADLIESVPVTERSRFLNAVRQAGSFANKGVVPVTSGAVRTPEEGE